MTALVHVRAKVRRIEATEENTNDKVRSEMNSMNTRDPDPPCACHCHRGDGLEFSRAGSRQCEGPVNEPLLGGPPPHGAAARCAGGGVLPRLGRQ